MANQEHVDRLLNSVKDWNHWRYENYTRPDLAKANLSNANLDNANLSNANLSNANLSGVFMPHSNLRNSDLSGAVLSKSHIFDSDFSSANLSGASINNSSFAHGRFHQADLSGVVGGADFDEGDLSEANFTNADIPRSGFHKANLTSANFSGANLQDVRLTWSNCYSARFYNANLRNADLRGTNFHYANLCEADLNNALLLKSIFASTNLSDAVGLDTCHHMMASHLDHLTIEMSGMLPINFLRGCGLPEALIKYLPSLLNQSISFYSCFISYSYADRVFARRLHDQLQKRGIRCWLDEHQLLPGDDIYDQVDQGIKLWDKVLLCASKDSLTSWWVDNEIDAAFVKEQKLTKQRGHKIWSLIPLNLDGYLFSENWQRGMADQVRSRLAADFTNWETDNKIFEHAFERVVKALKTDNAGREPAPNSNL